MKPYKNVSKKSGIEFYEIADDSITIQFKNKSIYVYDNHMPGSMHVKNMKELAGRGEGLATYINRYVRDKFAVQLR